MNAIVQAPTVKYQHPALQGLTEKALTAIFSNCLIRTLPPDTALFTPGEPIAGDYLLLEGSMHLLSQHNVAQVIPINSGDLLVAPLLQQDERYRYSCVARLPSTLLLLDEVTHHSLDDATQLLLYKNWVPLTKQLLAKLAKSPLLRGTAPQVNAEKVRVYLVEKQAAYHEAVALQAMLAKVPRLPPYTTKLTNLLDDPTSNTKAIIDIAKQDPSLTAAVLKTVNSPYYSLRHKVKDFQHAVMMLGFSQIQQLLLSTGLQNIMPNAPEFRQLQAHSMMISVLAHEISLTLKAGSPPMMSTLGILHDIGRSVVLLLKRQYAKQDFLFSMLDADMMGMLLLKEWQLPDPISTALQYQSYPELLPPSLIPAQHRTTVSVLHVAHLCLQRLRNLQAATPDPCPAYEYLAELGCRKLSLDEFLIGDLIPAIKARKTAMPLALQDLFKKAHSKGLVADKARA